MLLIQRKYSKMMHIANIQSNGLVGMKFAWSIAQAVLKNGIEMERIRLNKERIIWREKHFFASANLYPLAWYIDMKIQQRRWTLILTHLVCG